MNHVSTHKIAKTIDVTTHPKKFQKVNGVTTKIIYLKKN